jgi:nucleotide-binding universal stress UspA family protein
MEKILLAMDAVNLNTNAIDFACFIAKLTHSRLTGVFLEGLLDERPLVLVGDDIQEAVDANIRRFREACVCRNTLSLVHRDRGVPLSEVNAESRFADLIIVDPETAFCKKDVTIPGRFVKDVLRSAECPVLITPYNFEALDEIILTYDGSASSVFAIKEFTHLFPDFRRKKTTVVSIRRDGADALEEQFKMKEWLRAHYEDLHFEIRDGQATDELFGYLIEKKDAIVVMGAYGRNLVSSFFRPSRANLLVKTINLPIFIAHH